MAFDRTLKYLFYLSPYNNPFWDPQNSATSIVCQLS